LIILWERYSFLNFMKWHVKSIIFGIFCKRSSGLNRRTIDSESELVPEFNVEYFRGVFALIFIAEYDMIIFFMYLIVGIFTNLIMIMMIVVVY